MKRLPNSFPRSGTFSGQTLTSTAFHVPLRSNCSLDANSTFTFTRPNYSKWASTAPPKRLRTALFFPGNPTSPNPSKQFLHTNPSQDKAFNVLVWQPLGSKPSPVPVSRSSKKRTTSSAFPFPAPSQRVLTPLLPRPKTPNQPSWPRVS